ncbi:MAG: carbonic anhydrase family protein [Gammaproteobacteria bacterium]|nr:carbonic anhydrase family protein [Gammaproteobacteria bacterium]
MEIFKTMTVSILAATIGLTMSHAIASQSGGAEKHATKTNKSSHGNAHWGYGNDNGPNAWGDMSEDYHTCKAGQNQSPVDIREAVNRGLDKLEFHYSPSSLAIINNGHTIQVNYSGNSYLLAGGKRYNLIQFHFHAPSEHKIAGRASPMEMHLVHQATDGRLAVVGVMINRGVTNYNLQKAWDHLPSSVGNVNTYGSITINASSLLPSDKSYYHYNGSLTTPPCSEGVNWFVLQNPIQISPKQVKAFRNLVEDNARIIQPLHGRTMMSR